MQTTLPRPVKVMQFNFTFTGEDPMKILRGPNYDYLSETVQWGGLKIKPAIDDNETVTIYEVTGMAMRDVVSQLGGKYYRPATTGETVEIAETHRHIQGMGRFYAAGGSWYTQKHTHYIFLYLDNNVASTGIEGRSSHSHWMTLEEYNHDSLGGDHRVFVAVVGTPPTHLS